MGLMMQQEDRDMLISMHEICKDMKKALFGNGTPGLVSRMAVQETRMSEHLEGHRQPLRWPFIVSSICAVAALVVAIIK